MRIALSLALLNLWAFGAFWHDKQSAVLGRRRTPERQLLGLALVGGSFGAVLGQRLLRHKTRKQPFATYLLLIASAHAGLAIGLASLAMG
ncbi:DUF1294 domain-containing protein [Sphingomonas sp. ID1715]|uniref:DUF1294 domain-containing protein n=1 Tax=Sphingomonas sp. ID1715 TaxID=1656898 RepID=UPI001488A72B|nr:DUF1294 domain-containing protein [Sphingomonas sp. ID1715]NNM75463.1 DUF1294 domain-containing protein [Sphingomonas sp. ID1715]